MNDTPRIEHQWLGRIAYPEALALQEKMVQQRRDGETPDTIIFLEHEPVYTMGRRPDQSSLGDEALPHPIVEIARGGQATYHGPGQLIAYPILDLHNYGQDLHAYLRSLENAVIAGCRAMGMNARRRPELTGVWVENRKLASIGIGVRRWISMHGVSLNIGGDLTPYNSITPCGIEGVTMTSIEREIGATMSVERAARTFWPHFERSISELGRRSAHSARSQT